MPRFFVRHDAVENGFITIRGSDAHHIGFSLRMAVGETLKVCDMARTEYECSIASISSDTVILEILSESVSQNEPPYSVTLYQAMPKGDKFDTIVQKSVECGVAEVIPFYSEHCIAKDKGNDNGRKSERWNRIALEACKQTGRGILVPVQTPVSFDLAVSNGALSELPLFCYEGDGTIPLPDILKSKEKIPASISVMIGSEGGFSKEEAERATHAGWVPVGLGSRILRCETAPLFVLSALSYQFEL